MIWLSLTITLVAMIAACLSALYAILTHRQVLNFAHLELRIRVRDLHLQLHEDIDDTRTNNQTAIKFMDGAFKLAGSNRAEDLYQKEQERLTAQTHRLEKEITTLEPRNRTYADLDDNQLEEKLLELNRVMRVFVEVNSSATKWSSEYEAIYQRTKGLV